MKDFSFDTAILRDNLMWMNISIVKNLIIASTNEGKIKEFRRFFAQLPLSLIGQPKELQVEETGMSWAELDEDFESKVEEDYQRNKKQRVARSKKKKKKYLVLHPKN